MLPPKITIRNDVDMTEVSLLLNGPWPVIICPSTSSKLEVSDIALQFLQENIVNERVCWTGSFTTQPQAFP